MKKISQLVFALLLFQGAYAQNIKSADVEYRYVQLPLTPLPVEVKNFSSLIVPMFEMENQKKREQYQIDVQAAEDEYKREMDAYPAKVKAADDKYAREMAEWEKKPLAEKVVEKQVLNENNKPVKQVPPQPYKRTVPQPRLQKSYDYAALASTYLALEGYQNSQEMPVKIEVTMYGFDYTQPRQVTEQRDKSTTSNGTTTTTKVTYYRTEFTYRHPMSVKVTGADGKELFFLTPQELNTYKIYKTAETTTSQSINEDQLIATNEEKIMQENLTFIGNLVNDKIGFRRVPRKTEIYYVKGKEELYSDLMTAYNEGSSGMKLILDDPEGGKSKLMNAIQAWNVALGESEPTNKKARIDKNVTIMLCFNLLEGYFAIGDSSNSDRIFKELNALSLDNRERKQKETYEALYSDLKKRQAANKR